MIDIDLGDYGLALLPSGLRFVRDGLAGRFPLMTHSASTLMIAFCLEDDDEARRALVPWVAAETCSVLGLPSTAVLAAVVAPGTVRRTLRAVGSPEDASPA